MKALLTGFHILYHLSQYSTYFLRKVRYSVSGLELTLNGKPWDVGSSPVPPVRPCSPVEGSKDSFHSTFFSTCSWVNCRFLQLIQLLFFSGKKRAAVFKCRGRQARSARAPSVDARPGALRQRVHGLRQTGRKREAITSRVGPIGTSTWPIGRPPPSRGRGVQ